MTESILTSDGTPVFSDEVLANYRLTEEGGIDFIMMMQRARTGKDSTVSAMLGSDVIADCPCTVIATAGSKVAAGNGAVVHADLNSTVVGYAGAEIHARPGGRVTAKAGSRIHVYPGAYITAEAGATLIVPEGDSRSFARGVQVIEVPRQNHKGSQAVN